MTAESRAEHTFTPKQLENQRLFRVGPGAFEPEQPGDKGKRVVRKLAVFTGATAADLAESWGAELLLDKVNEHLLPHDVEVRASMGDKKLLNNESLMGAIGFIEDVASDEAYVLGMNAILRGMTGLEEVSYPSPTAKLIAGWTNLGSFASGRFQDWVNDAGKVVWKRPFYMKPWNIVNAVNAEAAIGLLEELPLGVGKAVEKLHGFIDRKLSKSEAVQFVEGTARAGVTGYHIVKNMMHDSRPVMPTPVMPAAA